MDLLAERRGDSVRDYSRYPQSWLKRFVNSAIAVYLIIPKGPSSLAIDATVLIAHTLAEKRKTIGAMGQEFDMLHFPMGVENMIKKVFPRIAGKLLMAPQLLHMFEPQAVVDLVGPHKDLYELVDRDPLAYDPSFRAALLASRPGVFPVASLDDPQCIAKTHAYLKDSNPVWDLKIILGLS